MTSNWRHRDEIASISQLNRIKGKYRIYPSLRLHQMWKNRPIERKTEGRWVPSIKIVMPYIAANYYGTSTIDIWTIQQGYTWLTERPVVRRSRVPRLPSPIERRKRKPSILLHPVCKRKAQLLPERIYDDGLMACCHFRYQVDDDGRGRHQYGQSVYSSTVWPSHSLYSLVRRVGGKKDGAPWPHALWKSTRPLPPTIAPGFDWRRTK